MLQTSHYDRCHGTELGEPFRDFACYRSLDLCPFWLIFLINNDNRIVIKRYPHSVRSAHLLFLADDNCTYQLAAHVGSAFLNTYCGKVSQPKLGLTAPDTVVTKDRNYLYGPCSGIIGACKSRSCSKCSWNSGLLCLHGCSTSTTTKVVLFDSGLHSAIFTMSPTFACMQGGLCA